jgi:hypothetical protein
MSITWMVVIGVLVFGQRLLPAKSAVDLPLPLAITGLGVLIVSTPSPVPGLSPPMRTRCRDDKKDKKKRRINQ